MKHENKLHTVGTCTHSNREIMERGQVDTSNTLIHDVVHTHQ